MAAGQSREAAWVRWVRVGLLLAGAPLAAMVQIALLPAMTQLAQRLSENGADGAFRAQLVMTIAAPAMAVGAPLIGWLAERIGKRRTFLGAALVYALAGFGGAFAPDFWTLLATRVLLGLASVGLITVAMAIVGESYSGAARDRIIGWITFVGSAGSLLILAVAGPMAEAGGWRAPFALYLVGIVVFLLALPTIVEKRHATAAAEIMEDASIRGAIPLFVLTVVLSIVMYMLTIQGPLALAGKGFTDPTIQSVIIMMTIVGTMVTSGLFGFVRARLGFSTILAMTFVGLGLGVVGFGVTANVVALGLFSLVVGLGSGFIQPLTQSEILGRVPRAASARAMGIAVGCIFMGQLLHPFVLKPIRLRFGVDDAFLYVGGASLAGAALTLAWRATKGMRRAAPAR